MAYQVNTCRAIVRELQAQAVPIHHEPGWETRGSINFAPRGLVVHHTADGPGEYPSLRIVRDGRSDLPGPLAQWGLGRSGKVYLIAAGRANHAGSGGWNGLAGNSTVWGIEAESTGRGDWTDVQRRNYPKLAAAIARHQPFGVNMICAHREWTTRKPDPTGIDMPSFRAEVARLLSGTAPAPAPPPTQEDDDVFIPIHLKPGEDLGFHIEPTPGHLGLKEPLLVLNTHGGRSVPVWVWQQSGGPGLVTITAGKPFVLRPSQGAPGMGAWLHIENRSKDTSMDGGLDTVFGQLMYRRV